MKYKQLTFSVAVCLSFACILRRVFWWSVTMVMRYDIISSRWSSHFWVKMHVFSTSFNNKSNDAKYLFMCYFTCQAQKLPFFAVLTWFLILGKIQVGDHCWWCHRPPAAPPPIKYTSSCWADQTLSTEGKIASKYCYISTCIYISTMFLFQGHVACQNFTVAGSCNIIVSLILI